MKKLIIGAFTLAFFSTPAHALYLSYCSNFAPSPNNPVSFSYQSCVNRNFSEVRRASDDALYLQFCQNYGNSVGLSYTGCINRNFSAIERTLEPRPYLQYCMNLSRDQLDSSFISCVNRNFSTIQRAMR